MWLAWCREPSSHLSLPLLEVLSTILAVAVALSSGAKRIARSVARRRRDRPLAVFRLALRVPLGIAAGGLFFALLQLFLLLLFLGATSVGTLLEVVGLHRHGRSPEKRYAESQREAPTTAPPAAESIEIRPS